MVAATAASSFNKSCQIVAYHANIKDSQFDINFFQKYNLVFNALDNVDARRHVNRLCLVANVPLIESGTTGYIGQVMPIIKNVTECYECKPKVTQKVYPICTIRSTPDLPVHCIVWAKELFKLLFGNSSESMLYEDPSGPEQSLYMPYTTVASSIGLLENVEHLLIALLTEDIQKKIDLGTYKTAKKTPVAYAIDSIKNTCQKAFAMIRNDNVKGNKLWNSSNKWPSSKSGWEQHIWNDSECLLEFILCIQQARENKEIMHGQYVFDKDDKWCMRFITAASNLRSRVFGITPLSYHDAKGVAGNIIPAIASTNAIIAGLQVLEGIKILSKSIGSGLSCKNELFPLLSTYCQRVPTRRGYYLQPTKPDSPNPSCYVCGTAVITLEVINILS